MKRGGKRKGTTTTKKKELVSEDWCFICKDGGELILCDYKDCLKAYHPDCLENGSSLVDSGKRWNCRCHSCLVCNRSSKFHCFCCPNAVCKRCIKSEEFVQVKGKNGFCLSCLKLAILIEENADADSDGEKLDFKDRDTYECLFKEYWDIINEKEGLTLEDLHTADILLKKGERFKNESDSDNPYESEQISDFDDMDDRMEDVPFSFNQEFKAGKQQPAAVKILRRVNSKKKEFIGWGSKALIQFLASIGKDPSKALTQHEVHSIIMGYILEKKLILPDKKKKVIFDVKLQAVFGKKSANKNTVYSLLESHFVENQDSDEDDFMYNAEEEATEATCKRQRKMNSDGAHEKVEIWEAPRSCFASVITTNIKLVYLKRSLLEKLLEKGETFEDLVNGSFVRVKTDPNDFLQKHSHQLVQVTGVKKTSGTSDNGKNVFLQVSNMHTDVQICMLSDDDFTEEECEDLRQRVKDGLLKRPTVLELEQKAIVLHEDITIHWIERELAMLRNLIDRANEKGWRRELNDYLEKRRILQSSPERQRLLQEVPKVIADEIELEATVPDLPKVEKTTSKDSPRSNFARASETVEDLGRKGTSSNLKGDGAVNCRKPDKGDVEECGDAMRVDAETDKRAVAKEAAVAAGEQQLNEPQQKTCSHVSEKLQQQSIALDREGPSNEICTQQEKVEKQTDSEIVVIELDDDDDDGNDQGRGGTSLDLTLEDRESEVWHYVDPFGEKQGPFSMATLKKWNERNYFQADFKVWKTGQNQKDAILLTDALSQIYSS